MRRAFVGFSTPIGYSYKLEAPRTRNDASSSPNPVLYGSIGLLTLYHEVWFACESLCPAAMRRLPYVKFLDVEQPGMRLPAQGFAADVDRAYELVNRLGGSFNIRDIFPQGYTDGMTEYLGGEFATDNHTHGLHFLGANLGGNPTLRNLVVDLWLLDRNKELKLDLTLNPLTAKLAFQLPDCERSREGATRLKQLELTENVLAFGSFYDITGPAGPYHPCVEEMRGDDLIENFRNWMDAQRTRLDNQDLLAIQQDVDARVRELTRKSLRAYVAPANLASVALRITKDELLSKIPGASVIGSVSAAIEQNKRAEAEGWAAFIALSRDIVTQAGVDAPE